MLQVHLLSLLFQINNITDIEKRFPNFIQRKLWVETKSYYPNKKNYTIMQQVSPGVTRDCDSWHRKPKWRLFSPWHYLTKGWFLWNVCFLFVWFFFLFAGDYYDKLEWPLGITAKRSQNLKPSSESDKNQPMAAYSRPYVLNARNPYKTA